MLARVAEIVGDATKKDVNESAIINIHHNYCRCEQCTFTDPRSGQQETRALWVTRKGATSAKLGELGIIPGSMGTGGPASWDWGAVRLLLDVLPLLYLCWNWAVAAG